MKKKLLHRAMRYLLSLCILTPVFTHVYGQNTWTGASGGSWNTGTNWSAGHVPTSSEDVVVNTSVSININTSPTIKSLTITGSAAVTFAAASGSRTITISGTGSSIAAGSSLTLAGVTYMVIPRTLTLKFSGSSQTMSVAGSLILRAAGAGGDYDATNSITTVTGLLKNDGGGGGLVGVFTSTTSNLIIAAGATYEHATNAGTIPTATWNAASTCLITGTTLLPPLGMVQAFGNLTWNCSGQLVPIGILSLTDSQIGSVQGNFTMMSTGSASVYLASAYLVNITIAGNLIQTGGTFTISTLGAYATLNVNGDLNKSGGTFNLTTGTAIGTLNLKGNYNQTGGNFNVSTGTQTGVLNVKGNFTATGGSINETAAGAGQIYFTGGGPVQTYTSGGTVSGNVHFTVNPSSFLQMASAGTTITGDGEFTLSAGATLGIMSADGISTGTAYGHIRTTEAHNFGTGAHYIYNGTTSQNIGDGFPDNLTGSLTINNPGNTVTLGNARTIANGGTINLTAGTLAAGTNLSMGSTSVINRSGGSMTGTLQGTGAYNVFFTGDSKTAGAELTGSGLNSLNLNLNATQSLRLAQNTSAAGVLTLSNGVLIAGTYTLTLSSNSTGAVSGGSASSYVSGTLVRNIAAGTGNYSFPIGTAAAYAPVALTFNAGTVAGYLQAATAEGDHTDIMSSTFDFKRSVNRHWDFTVMSGLTASGYDAVINWVTGDQDTPFDYTVAYAGKFSSGTWTYPTVATRNPSSITVTGLSGFSSFQVGDECLSPDLPGIGASENPICLGSSATLSITSGSLKSAEKWYWYRNSCGDTLIDSGTLITVSPAVTTTYYVRGEGGCVKPGECSSIVLSVSQPPVAPTGASVDHRCVCPVSPDSITLSYTGGSGLVLSWYADSCGGTSIGSGQNLKIHGPAVATTYYARWESDPCTPSDCASVEVVIDTEAPYLADVHATSAQFDVSGLLWCLDSALKFDPHSLEADVLALYTDDCDTAITSAWAKTDTGSTNSDCSWTFTYHFNISDKCSNIASCTVTYSGGDTLAPVLADPAVNCSSLDAHDNIWCLEAAEAFDPASLEDTVASLYTDNCDEAVTATWTYTDNPETNTDCNWTLTYHFDVADNCSNITSCSVIYTGGDTLSPVLADPGVDCSSLDAHDLLWCLEEAAAFDPASLEVAVASLYEDNCDDSVTAVFVGKVAGENNTDCNWRMTYTYEISDNCGNTTVCSVNYSGGDTLAPEIVYVPEDIVVDNQPLLCSAVVNWTHPSAVDNCDEELSWWSDHLPGEVFPVGTTLVTYTATDNCSNVSTCSFSVTVNDVEPPLVTCSFNFLIAADPGQCGALLAVPVPDMWDNCGIASFYNDFNSTADASDFYPVGTTTVTWYVKDVHDNLSTCSMIIHVTDQEVPVIHGCPQSFTVSTDPGLCGAVVYWTAPVASDNCGIFSFTSYYHPGDFFPKGQTVVHYNAVDFAGNTTPCAFTVTVEDHEKPVIACLPDIYTGECNQQVSFASPDGTDNCPGAVTTQVAGLPGGSVFPVGVTENRFVVTDASGNVDSCSFFVTIYANPVAGFTASAVCEGQETAFTDTSTESEDPIVSRDWDFGDGSHSADQNPVHTYASHGTHTVSLTVTTADGCISSTQGTAEVYPLPAAGFTSVYACDLSPVAFTNTSSIGTGTLSYTWDFGDGATSQEENPAHQYLATGTFNVTLTALSDHGCEDVFQAPVSVYDLPEEFSVLGGGNYCAGGAGVGIELSGSENGVSYLLQVDGSGLQEIPGNGSALDFGLQTAAGNYTVLATNLATGCVKAMDGAATIATYELPLVEAGPDLTVNAGSSVVLGAAVTGGLPPYVFAWSPSDYLSDPGVMNPEAGPINTTVYTLYVMDQHGCAGTDSAEVAVTTPTNTLYGRLAYDNASATPLPMAVIELKDLSGAVQYSTQTGADGFYMFPAVNNGTYVIGAVTGLPWGGVNSNDALIISRYFVNIMSLAGLRLQAADLNGDHSVNAMDALLDASRFIGQTSSFPVGDWVFTTDTLDLYGGIFEYDFNALCYGDVNGSYSPQARQAPQVRIASDELQAYRPGEVVELPVSAEIPMEIGAVSLVLEMPAGVEALGARMTVPGNHQDLVFDFTDGKLRIAWYSLDPVLLQAGDPLLVLDLRLPDQYRTVTGPLSVTAFPESELGDPYGATIPGAALKIPGLYLGNNDFWLGSNSPNPFSGITEIRYRLPETGVVTLTVYNQLGEKIRTLVNGSSQEAGSHTVTFDGSALPAGLYSYRIEWKGSGKNEIKSHMMIIRR